MGTLMCDAKMGASMTMTWRSWALVSLSVVAGLIALVILATLQFEATLTRLVQGRLVILAQSMELPFRSATSLGLPLASVRNAKAILERVRHTDASIVAIHVYDSQGRIVHSTAHLPPDALDTAALQAYRAAEDATWVVDAGDRLLSSVVVFNSLRSQTLGGVVVVYPKSEITMATLAMFARLTVAALAIAILSAAMGLPILALVLRRFDQSTRAMDADLSALERREWRAGAGGDAPEQVPDDTPEDSALSRIVVAAENRYHSAGIELAKLEAVSGQARQ